ncbi:MAG TPA: hypothetical protein P5084_12710 [Paludibacter sp.]|nr:hypothetical protein [Paludibacter sp.]
MKTSNKLLLGAFVLILIGMIATNLRFKTELDKIKKTDVNKGLIQETDSLSNDSTFHVKIDIN